MSPRTELPANISDPVLGIFETAARPECPPFPEVTSIEWNGAPLPLEHVSFRLEEDRLLIDVRCPLSSNVPNSNKHYPLEVTFVDGNKLVSEEAFIGSVGGAIGTDFVGHHYTCVAYEWRWRVDSSAAVSAWYARGHGRIEGPSNTVVAYQNGKRMFRALWLEDEAVRYLLVPREPSELREFDMVLFASEELATRARLWPYHTTLEFLFGDHLMIKQLIGTDKNGRVVEIRGAEIGSRGGRRSIGIEPAVPLQFFQETWISPFFQKLAKLLPTHAPLRRTLGLAAEAIGRMIDSEYLELQVALEGFAKALTAAEVRDVRDEDEWRAWVKSVKEAVEEMAAEGRADALINRLIDLARRGTSSLVAQKFKELGRPLRKDHVKEVGGRNVIAHTASMTAGEPYDFPRDTKKIAMIRTLLVALVALSVGYRGKITGWEQNERGELLVPDDWWQLDPVDEAIAKKCYSIRQPATD